VRNHRKEKRFGPGPANGYTSGSGTKRGLFGRKRRAGVVEDPNALPVHSHPNDVRDSYATEQTRVGSYGDTSAANGFNKHGESGFKPVPAGANEHPPYHTAPHTAPAPVHAGAPVVNPYRSDVHSGVQHGTHVNDMAPAQYPTGNYKYEDGTYNSRV
jgi:hypothetical protein